MGGPVRGQVEICARLSCLLRLLLPGYVECLGPLEPPQTLPPFSLDEPAKLRRQIVIVIGSLTQLLDERPSSLSFCYFALSTTSSTHFVFQLSAMKSSRVTRDPATVAARPTPAAANSANIGILKSLTAMTLLLLITQSLWRTTAATQTEMRPFGATPIMRIPDGSTAIPCTKVLFLLIPPRSSQHGCLLNGGAHTGKEGDEPFVGNKVPQSQKSTTEHSTTCRDKATKLMPPNTPSWYSVQCWAEVHIP